jgi:hypothetical protein
VLIRAKKWRKIVKNYIFKKMGISGPIRRKTVNVFMVLEGSHGLPDPGPDPPPDPSIPLGTGTMRGA